MIIGGAIGVLFGRMLPVGKGNEAEYDSGGNKSPNMLLSRNFSGGTYDGERWRSAKRTEKGYRVTELDKASGFVGSAVNGPLVVVPASLIDRLSQAGGRRSMSQDLFSRDRELEGYLQITEEEKASLQGAWRETRKAMRQLEADSVRLEDLPDGSVRITVPEIAWLMSGVSEGFQSASAEILGRNRSHAFLAMKQVDAVLGTTSGKKVYTVKVEAIGDGHWRYHMTAVGADGQRQVWVGKNVPTAIRHLTDVVGIEPKMNVPEEGEFED